MISESERLASHIVEKAKAKIKRNSKRQTFTVPESKTSKKIALHHSPATNGSRSSITEIKKQRAILPPLSPVENMGASQKSPMEYSKRYKEIQKKWQEDLQEQRQSTPVVLSPLLKSHRFVKTTDYSDNHSVDNTAVPVDDKTIWRHNVEANISDSVTATKCKRRLTFAENFKETKKLYSPVNKDTMIGIAGGHSTGTALPSGLLPRKTRSFPRTSTQQPLITADHSRLMAKPKEFIMPAQPLRQRRNSKDIHVALLERQLMQPSKEQRETEFARQQKISLKLLQRTQVSVPQL